MSNMSYCRFYNTIRDLQDCYDNLDDDALSDEEKSARTELIKTCVDIAEGYGCEVEHE